MEKQKNPVRFLDFSQSLPKTNLSMFPTVRSVDEQVYSPGFRDEDINNIDYDLINTMYYNRRIFKRSSYVNPGDELRITNICCTRPCTIETLIEYCPKRDSR